MSSSLAPPPKRKLRHEDYRIGWICPLPIEKAAAEAMLDEVHETLPNPALDKNVYTVGRIGKHDVAIAGLPMTGIISTANVANHMQYTFRALRIVLVVGIGGGAPSEERDIRLGDIVVSRPDGIYGGVVQVDFGKTVPTSVHEYAFTFTGTLNRPPDLLLNAVGALQTKHLGVTGTEVPMFTQYISQAIKSRPRMKARYPGAARDQLFRFSYDHETGNQSCHSCDARQLVEREARDNDEPEIHFGLIASANNVRKDGSTREKLRRRLNILCFEMEAAAVMDTFPCLVIRGISDYSDSHKNKQWQPYAAVVAAAYAKELLSIVPETDVNALSPVARVTPGEHTHSFPWRYNQDNLRF